MMSLIKGPKLYKNADKVMTNIISYVSIWPIRSRFWAEKGPIYAYKVFRPSRLLAAFGARWP